MYLSICFFFFCTDIMTTGILRVAQNSLTVPYASNRGLKYLGAFAVCFLESLSYIKMRVVG